MFGGSDLPSGVHGDVMGANPKTDDDKRRLVDEIKNRAKSILGSTRNYQEASGLYTKGIEVLPNDAILYGNRSMCYLSMKKTAQALEDADKAIELDSTYAKAYYRKAMAELELGNLAASYDALQENLKLAPTDKAVQTQLAKVTDLRDKAGNSGSGNSSVPKARNTVTNGVSTRTLPPAAPSDSTPAVVPNIPSLPKPKPSPVKEDVVVENVVGSNMKGYKVTADGKKTSYFNHDLDDKTKELIGDIRPKKIEAPAAIAAAPTSVTTSSAWNTAGTFEEKSVTPWAKECLQNHLGSVEVHVPSVFPHPAAGADAGARDVPLVHLDLFISISKVKSVTGDASTVYNRGKKKYLYDFTVECEWKFKAYVHTDVVDGQPGAGASPVLTANGNITLNDITPDDDCDCTVSVSASKNNSTSISKNELTGILSKYVRADGSYSTKTVVVDKLQVGAKKHIKQFDTEFKSKY